MEIVASGGALGAEVKGIDMRAPLKADEVAAIKQGGTITSFWFSVASLM